MAFDVNTSTKNTASAAYRPTQGWLASNKNGAPTADTGLGTKRARTKRLPTSGGSPEVSKYVLRRTVMPATLMRLPKWAGFHVFALGDALPNIFRYRVAKCATRASEVQQRLNCEDFEDDNAKLQRQIFQRRH